MSEKDSFLDMVYSYPPPFPKKQIPLQNTDLSIPGGTTINPSRHSIYSLSVYLLVLCVLNTNYVNKKRTQ